MKRLLIFLLTLVLIITISGCGSEPVSNNEENQEATAEEQVEEELTLEEQEEKAIDEFVASFNSSSDVPLEFVEEFVPSENSEMGSSHYKREFRLAYYDETVGKSYAFGGATVDIVASKAGFYEDLAHLRIYIDNATLDNNKNMVSIATPIIDETATPNDIQTALDQMTETPILNGYYCADTVLVINYNSDNDTYRFMMEKR